jgi:CBS domain-containing protein
MSQSVVTIKPEATMYEAAKVMGEKHIGSLIVLEDKTPLGIVTERDLLSSVLAIGRNPKEINVSSVMSTPLITIGPSESIKKAAQTMINKKGRLAVIEEEKLVGIITASDLIRSMPHAPETILKVEDYMTKKVVTADKKATIYDAVKTMGEKRIGSVIVTHEGEPIGIFTERDLLSTFLAKDKPLDVSLSKAASSPLITAPSWISVHHAAQIMASRHIRRLPLTEDDELVGIITARDLVEAYSK